MKEVDRSDTQFCSILFDISRAQNRGLDLTTENDVLIRTHQYTQIANNSVYNGTNGNRHLLDKFWNGV